MYLLYQYIINYPGANVNQTLQFTVENPGYSRAIGGTFDYRGFNISEEIMLDPAAEVTGKRELPGFSENVICDGEAACGDGNQDRVF